MANQADWPDIYIDASAAGGGDGSQASPYDSFSDINWTTGGDNSVYDYYAGTPAASLTINLKRGEVWRGTTSAPLLVTGCGGTESYPIPIQTYGTGDNPVIDGSVDISSAAFKWTASGSGTNEYYLEAAAGGTPGITEPKQVFIDDVRCGFAAKAPGALDDHDFAWGDNDTLGYNTVYVRDDTGDPDTSGVQIDASVGPYYLMYLQYQYITVQNIDTKRSNGHGYRFVGSTNGHHVIVKDCVSTQNYWGAGGYAGANNCELNNVEVDRAVQAGIGFSGTIASPITGLLITGCSVHDTEWAWTGYWEAAGTKMFALEGATITKSTWYNNPGGGIRLDGLSVDNVTGGCNRCVVSENLLYNNGYKQIEIEFSEENVVEHNYIRSPADGVSGICISKSISNGNIIRSNISTGATGDVEASFETRASAGATSPNLFYNNTAYGSRAGYRMYGLGGADLRNNISDNMSFADLMVFTEDLSHDSDYNCFSGDGTHTFYEKEAAGGVGGGKTLAQWQTYTGTETNSLEQDPLLTDPSNGDFTLSSGSPCIGAGETLASAHDDGLAVGTTWPDGVLTADRDD